MKLRLNKKLKDREARRARIEALQLKSAQTVDLKKAIDQLDPLSRVVMLHMKANDFHQKTKAPGYDVTKIEVRILFNGHPVVKEDFDAIIDKVTAHKLERKIRELGFNSVKEFMAKRHALLTETGYKKALELTGAEEAKATKQSLSDIMGLRLSALKKAAEAITNDLYSFSEAMYSESESTKLLFEIHEASSESHLTDNQCHILQKIECLLNIKPRDM